jgi:hypothetical protein
MRKSAKQRQLNSSMFTYWTDNSTYVEANPDPPSPQEARPFVVRVSNSSYIPINTVVFARDEEHAKLRVRAALDECCERDYNGETGRYHEPHRAWGVRDQLISGKLRMIVAPFDIRVMSETQWASNGGF